MSLARKSFGAVITAGLWLAVHVFNAGALQLPGVVPPSACRVGAVLSTDQFTTTGFSNVRTGSPSDVIVAGAWVIANNFTPDTSVVLPPNCIGPLAGAVDGAGLNLMAVRIKPTISSAAEANIREIKLAWDVNLNGFWDPLLDLVLQSKPGSALDSQEGALFFNGPQSPLAFLSNSDGVCDDVDVNDAAEAVTGVGPANGTNSRGAAPGKNGCFIGLLAIAVIGDSPQTGSQFGLELEAFAGDIPGSTGISSFTISNSFSSSRNPQAANVRLHMIGGLPSSHTPVAHISNSSGAPESAVRPLTFTGGQQGEGLLTRFRALEIRPGTREVIAMAVGICDGAELANTTASVLPAIAGAPPTIAGGLAALPCIPSSGTDGFATGVSGAVLVFRGPLARYMSTVRLYVDECAVASSTLPSPLCLSQTGGAVATATTRTAAGGGDGILFQSGELVRQMVPKFNEQTGEAIVQFGYRQVGILNSGNGSLVVHGSDPCSQTVGGCGAGLPAVAVPTAGTRPLILIWTVDIDQNAPGGVVDVVMGLQSFDDTAQNIAPGAGNACTVFALTAPSVPAHGGLVGASGSCASNFLNVGPETYSFTVEGPEHPSTPNTLAAFDTNNSCFLDDPEFFAMIDGWVANDVGDTLFFAGVDAWVAQENICAASASGAVAGLQLTDVALEAGALGTTIFVARGQRIERIRVSVFSLSGRLLFAQSARGNHLIWNHQGTHGAPLANGTYLYSVSVEGADGRSVNSDVKRLVIMR